MEVRQENQASGDQKQNPSGNAQVDNPNTDDKSNDTVKYESYRKVLSEKKKVQGELESIRQENETLKKAEKERQEAELKAKEDFKKLAELKEEELTKEREQRTSLERRLDDGLKLKSFLNAVSGDVGEEYWSLINLDEIVIDPNSNLPDPTSVQKVAKAFEDKYSKVIDKPGGPRLPNNAPVTGTPLTYEEWRKLPLKDMKARMKDVVKTE